LKREILVLCRLSYTEAIGLDGRTRTYDHSFNDEVTLFSLLLFIAEMGIEPTKVKDMSLTRNANMLPAMNVKKIREKLN